MKGLLNSVSSHEPGKGRTPEGLSARGKEVCVEKGERLGHEAPLSPSMNLTCDHHQKLLEDLRSMGVGWGGGRPLRMCALLFVLLIAFLNICIFRTCLQNFKSPSCGFLLPLLLSVDFLSLVQDLVQGLKQETAEYQFCLKFITKLVSLPSLYE